MAVLPTSLDYTDKDFDALRSRLIALALVAGVFWEPVWEASKALIDREVEQSRRYFTHAVSAD